MTHEISKLVEKKTIQTKTKQDEAFVLLCSDMLARPSTFKRSLPRT